jgi:hypothetical protein
MTMMHITGEAKSLVSVPPPIVTPQKHVAPKRKSTPLLTPIITTTNYSSMTRSSLKVTLSFACIL